MRISPNRQIPLDTLDGLLVGGGDDISWSLYMPQEQWPELRPAVRIDLERDHVERDLINAAIARHLPVLGICRGAQMINVAHGGTLHTDIYSVHDGVPAMHTPQPRKRIQIEAGSRLHELLGTMTCRVNALHHQSVDQLGQGLRVAARDENGIIQAIEAPGEPFLLGVQWHPDFLVFDRGQMRLFERLVGAARNHTKAVPAAA